MNVCTYLIYNIRNNYIECIIKDTSKYYESDLIQYFIDIILG